MPSFSSVRSTAVVTKTVIEPPPAVAQRRNRVAQHVEGAEHVGIHDAAEVGFRDLQQRAQRNGRAGRGDDVRDAAVETRRLPEEGGHRVGDGDVELDSPDACPLGRERGDERVGALAVRPVADQDRGTRGEAAHDRLAEPSGAADDRDTTRHGRHLAQAALPCIGETGSRRWNSTSGNPDSADSRNLS
jgi:hypothetical protein